jgi:FixJ family two-component response regulator
MDATAYQRQLSCPDENRLFDTDMTAPGPACAAPSVPLPPLSGVIKCELGSKTARGLQRSPCGVTGTARGFRDICSRVDLEVAGRAVRHGPRPGIGPNATYAMFTVFLVDDDARVLKALSRLLGAKGYDTRSFASPQEFLAQHEAAVPGCAVLDVSMPGLDGLALQQILGAGGEQRPIIFLTGKADIPTSVRAMKAGAIDFLTKPVKEKDLLQAIARAEEIDSTARQSRAELVAIQTKIATLTPREREVLSHVVAGRLNKQIASDLGTVEKTIKVHRGRMMKKLGVRTIADLVRLAEKAGISVAKS